jgi:hypothetical protein
MCEDVKNGIALGSIFAIGAPMTIYILSGIIAPYSIPLVSCCFLIGFCYGYNGNNIEIDTESRIKNLEIQDAMFKYNLEHSSRFIPGTKINIHTGKLETKYYTKMN